MFSSRSILCRRSAICPRLLQPTSHSCRYLTTGGPIAERSRSPPQTDPQQRAQRARKAAGEPEEALFANRHGRNIGEGAVFYHNIDDPLPESLLPHLGDEHTRKKFVEKLKAGITSEEEFRRMASEAEEQYMAFLEKANQDPSAETAAGGKEEVKPQQQQQQGQQLKATDDGAQVPAALREAAAGAVYVSDADEPFVPVCLAWDEAGKGLPDEEEFASLIEHPSPPASAGVELQDPAEWDPRGQYRAVLDAVRAATGGADVRVYRVPHPAGGARVEYWVVGAEGKGKEARLVGAKALAVES
ncbi:hypothetical protein GGR56DRAFT_366159 [Xylariaceae sp. FL0804]|nr:hypothetical protein GGR56DRAFT_366159 [Xylariaceae sp. FL0804]